MEGGFGPYLPGPLTAFQKLLTQPFRKPFSLGTHEPHAFLPGPLTPRSLGFLSSLPCPVPNYFQPSDEGRPSSWAGLPSPLTPPCDSSFFLVVSPPSPGVPSLVDAIAVSTCSLDFDSQAPCTRVHSDSPVPSLPWRV